MTTKRSLRLRLEHLEDRTTPAFVATVVGADVVFAGNAAGDLLQFDLDSSGLLIHNRFAIDPGFASPFDLDTGLLGTQALAPGVVNTLTVNAGAGNDVVQIAPALFGMPTALNGQFGNDRLEGANPIMTGGDGNDTLVGTAGNDSIAGNAGNDVLIGNAGNDVLEAGLGIDAVFDGAGDDLVNFSSNAAPVTFVSQGGNDTILGTAFDDTLTGNTGNDRIEGFGGNDSLVGGAGADAFFGGDGDDSVVGGPGNDFLSAGNGSDLFTWDNGDGSDALNGDDNLDTLVFRGSASPETFTFTQLDGRLRLLRDVGGVVMDMTGFEQVDLSMLGGADTVGVGDLGATEVRGINIDAGEGDAAVDTVNVLGRPIADGLAITSPAGGAVSVTGLSYSILAGSLEPALDVFAVDGGDGNDILDASLLPAVVVSVLRLRGGNGADGLLGSGGRDDGDGGPGDDTLVGAGSDDTLVGGTGNDHFVWNDGHGTDLIEGGDGNDTVSVNGSLTEGDAFTAGPNADRVSVTRSNLTPFSLDIGAVENLVISGQGGADSFNVAPLLTTSLGLNGDAPTTAPGDSLVVDTTGTTPTVIPATGQTDGGYAFADRAPIGFTGMESVTPSAAVPPSPPPPPIPIPPIPILPPIPIPPPPTPPVPPIPPPPTPPVPPSPPTVVPPGDFAAGPGPGGGTTVQVYTNEADIAYSIAAFDRVDSPGGVRVALADVTGDGIRDVIAGTGPGVPAEVRVFDGETRQLLTTLNPFESSFLGGVFVAAGDINGDSLADIVVTPDEGGGPRVRVFRGGDYTPIADFFGIDDPDFRGGARAAVGRVNADSLGDVLVAAGFSGGPRIAGYDGLSIASGTTNPEKLFADFFVFESTLRNGVFLGAGDLDGDGFADVIAGAGPGGAPRVFALSGQDLTTTASQTQVANFFAGDVENRGGIHIVAKDLDGDDRADLVTGDGVGAGSQVTGYAGVTIATDGTPPELFAFDAFSGFTGGVFVG